MKKQLVAIPEVSKTVEVLYADYQIAKGIEIAYLAPPTPTLFPTISGISTIPAVSGMTKKQPPKKNPPKPIVHQDNSMVLWALVDNINRGEVDKLPEASVSDAIKTLMNSKSFSILSQICTEDELRNFAVYVILRGKDVYNECFVSDAIIDEYPIEDTDLYETYVDL